MKPIAFLVDKPAGMGSTDVVRHFKRNLPKPFKKIGHFGTLDPFATGLLIIGINGAQRLSDYLHSDYPKTYRALGRLGMSSDTGDKTGQLDVIDSDDELKKLTSQVNFEKKETQWKKVFSKGYMQAPPAYSAAKHKGKNLYEYARKGIIIEKPKVLREILDLKILEVSGTHIEFEVTVSSGTYIRVLFEDMAKSLGTAGHLEELRRVRIGPHDVSKASALKSWPIEGIALEQLYEGASLILPNDKLEQMYRNGIKINLKDLPQQYLDEQKVWVKSQDGDLLGLAQCTDKDLKILFNFPQNS